MTFSPVDLSNGTKEVLKRAGEFGENITVVVQRMTAIGLVYLTDLDISDDENGINLTLYSPLDGDTEGNLNKFRLCQLKRKALQWECLRHITWVRPGIDARCII